MFVENFSMYLIQSKNCFQLQYLESLQEALLIASPWGAGSGGWKAGRRRRVGSLSGLSRWRLQRGGGHGAAAAGRRCGGGVG